MREKFCSALGGARSRWRAVHLQARYSREAEHGWLDASEPY